MGYSERVCQLCGIAFNIGRIRTLDEPPEFAWDETASAFVALSGDDTCDEGCSDIRRDEDHGDYLEHIAGVKCQSRQGYSGHRISADEMRAVTHVQCLLPKEPDWKPELGDEDFEKESKISFVSGISTQGACEFEIEGLRPVKHGVKDCLINNVNDGDDVVWGLPMHPRCFEMFKNMSLDKFDKIDIDGLWILRDEQGGFTREGFENFTRAPDLSIVVEQWYICEPGTEYLAADPINVPGLEELISSCIVSEERCDDVVFNVLAKEQHASDPFAVFSPELSQMVIQYLPREDVANLRLASQTFTQLPLSYFHALVKCEMPWVWEIKSLQPIQVDWYKLWCKLSAADGGSCMDEKQRKWKEDVKTASTERFFDDVSAQGMFGWGEKSSNPEAWKELYERKKQKLEADIQAGCDSGMWPLHKHHTLKGLRNRRRIFKDIEEILRRIADLDRDGNLRAT